MSADNYYIIRKHPLGGFTPVMGFASDQIVDGEWNGDIHPDADVGDPQFDTPEDALQSVIYDYAEYGHDIHSECYGNDASDADVVNKTAEGEDSVAGDDETVFVDEREIDDDEILPVSAEVAERAREEADLMMMVMQHSEHKMTESKLIGILEQRYAREEIYFARIAQVDPNESFTRAEIVDTYGATIDVGLSSAAMAPHMWLRARGGGTVNKDKGETGESALHLGIREATWLRDKLNQWINDAKEGKV